MQKRYKLYLNAIAFAVALAYGGIAAAFDNDATIDQTGSGNTVPWHSSLRLS